MEGETIGRRELAHLYKPVGELIVVWSTIDISLTRIAVLIFRIARAAQAERKVPRPFGARVAIMQRNFTKGATFAEHKSKTPDLLRRIEHLQKLRDFVVHGYPSRYDSAEDKYIFVRFDAEDDGRGTRASGRHNKLGVSYESLQAASRDCIEVSGDLLAIERQLLKRLMPEHEPDNPHRRIVRR